MFELKKLLRPHILTLTPYSSARDEYTGKEGVFLDANENPLGSADGFQHNRYPDPYQQAVKEQLATIKEVKASQIFLGNGSDEAIDLLFRAFCEPNKDNIITLPPTYGMYSVSAEINVVENIKVPLTTDYDIDPDAILEQVNASTKIIFICSPNNPTGNSISVDKIIQVLDNTSAIVVVDEAYIDFSKHTSFTKMLEQYPQLVILQTFSKAWGMAALRLGMAFASEEIIQILNKIKPPYNINQLTQEMALKALSNVSTKNEMVELLLKERERLSEALIQLPYVQKIYDSDANFILAKMDDANGTYQKLLDQMIIVRNRSSVMLCEGSLRISVGTPEENDQLIKAMQAL